MNHINNSQPVVDLAPFLLHQGTNFHAADYLGAHQAEHGVVFRRRRF